MEKALYKIQEVSDLLEVPKSKLRYWESVIPQLTPYKYEGKRRRYYTPEDLALLRRIKFLREEQNLPIEVVIATLNADSAEVDTKMNTIQILQKLRNELIEIRKRV